MIVEALRLPGPFVPGWFPLVIERLDPIVGPPRGERTARVLGSQMCLDTRESMQRRYFYHCYEAPEAAFLRRWLRPGDHVADVGAHVGVFTLLAAKLVGPTGHAYAFEPIPDNFKRLAGNIALNGYTCVTAENVAVSDTSGTVMLGLHEERSVGSSTADFSIGGTLSTVQASVVALDEYFHDRNGLRLLKIDAEGTEPQVLDGARGLLAHNPPEAILVEVNNKLLRRHDSRPADLLERLASSGYTVHGFGRFGRLKPLPSLSRLEEAARRREARPEPRSNLIVGWTTRHTMFNAVAIRRSGGHVAGPSAASL